METKKKLNLSICAAIYGFLAPIIQLVFMSITSPYGFDTSATDEVMLSVAIDLIIGVIGVVMSIVYSRKLTNEKLSQLTQAPVGNVCNYCKINVASNVDICPKCGNKIK